MVLDRRLALRARPVFVAVALFLCPPPRAVFAQAPPDSLRPSAAEPATDGASRAAPAPADGVNQVLRPGDMVRLRIWREPDLSGEFRVDEFGVAVFPKLGAVPVGRLAADSVRALLVASYSRFLQNPSVEVVFLRRVNVLGWVRSPGLYYVDPTMRLEDVLALAGGPTPDGNAKVVDLFREGERISAGLSQQLLVADLPLRSGDQLRVPQRSWFARNSAAVVAAGISGAALVAAALLHF